MRIVLDAGAGPRLENADDFSRFSISIDPLLDTDRKSAVSPIADMADLDHAWVRPDAVRALSPMAQHSGWNAKFVAMIAAAEKFGWLDSQGRIRAHVEVCTNVAPVATSTFRNAMGRFASGVCVVATGNGKARCGMTVSAFSSVSADPPLVLVCLNRSAFAHSSLTNADRYSINILSAEQEDVALLFAGQKGLHGSERFDTNWQQSAQGAPVMPRAHQWIVCANQAQYRAGSHTVLIGRVVEASEGFGRAALVNYKGYMAPSVHPENA